MAGSDVLDIQPVSDDGLGAVHVGLVLWLVAGGVLLVRRAELAEQGNEWWLLSCLAGLVVGLLNWATFATRAANAKSREARSGGSPTAEQAG